MDAYYGSTFGTPKQPSAFDQHALHEEIERIEEQIHYLDIEQGRLREKLRYLRFLAGQENSKKRYRGVNDEPESRYKNFPMRLQAADGSIVTRRRRR